MQNKSELRRFTSLAALLRILQKKAITLLPTTEWDDRNDRALVQMYIKSIQSKTSLALCFTETIETVHHWRAFAHGSDGVCIVFEKHKLLAQIDSLHNSGSIRHGSMQYLRLVDLPMKDLALDELPFMKRIAYVDEKEYRILLTGEAEKLESKDIKIEPEVILRILVNPWVPDPLFEAMKESIRSIEGFSHIPVTKSTCGHSDRWLQLVMKSRKRYDVKNS